MVYVNGVKIGIRIGFGTGGDTGHALAGLSKLFYNPELYDILPMRHNYTKTGEYALTGFFIPSYRIVVKDEQTGEPLMDKRGFTDSKKGQEYYNKHRDRLSTDPEGYMIYCAEYCFTPDDALALEGDNQFNRVLLVDQLAEIKQFKRGPKIERGYLEYNFDGRAHIEQNIQGFKWIPSQSSKLQIIERPLKDESGKPYRNLYVCGIDGIDLGKSETSTATKDPSDFCVTVFRRAFGVQPPMFVALYKDRPNDIREAYKTALKLCEWYNCQAVLENSKISIRQFFQEKNKANKYLMRRPRATMTDSLTGNSRQFGAPATETIIHH
ncbi:MAG: hypothetical protein Nk1A_8780 [Endomicrobiia bacterium]|nr:MAG: hypothetical protein Nk1A_8780 [Endomicrobiia bacterium]